MKDLLVTASELHGTVTPPPFKSEVIRFLILAALSGTRPSSIISFSEENGDDINAAAEGIETAFFSDCDAVIPVGDSAALLRLIAPIVLSRKGLAVFSVGGSLFRREIFGGYSDLGWEFSHYRESGEMLISVRGSVPHGRITLDASESSQTASGLLLCLAAVPELSIKLTDPVSLPYIELTLKLLSEFGISVRLSEDGFYYADCCVPALPESFCFQPDYSYAANFAAANYLIGGDTFRPVVINGGESAASQPDHAVHRLLPESRVSVRNCPDLFPILCVCALKKQEDTVITDIARLKTKESDRVLSTRRLIESIGGSIYVFDDYAVIPGCEGKLCGGEVDSFGDHRIVMAAAVASLLCCEPVIIRGADAVKKSAPRFFSDFERLGGTVHELIRE